MMDAAVSERLFQRRRIVNVLALVLSGTAAMVGLFFLVWILFTTLSKGIDGLSLAMFTEMTPPPGAEIGVGGLLNAIVGSIVMCTLAVLMAAPVGIAAGTYLAEYANFRKIGSVIRFVNDILLSAPSIVLGLFVYMVLIGTPRQVATAIQSTEAGQQGWLAGVADWLIGVSGFSAIAGAVALGFIVLPVVVRTTDEMLRLVPAQMREAALSLGIPQWKVTVHVLYRAALSGILTGVMLGLARISGETAPLLFTAFNNSFWNLDLGEPMANLPVTVYQFAMSPFENWQLLAWAGAFLITCFVLLVSITARTLLLRKKIAND
ncbi:phosphate ABC transporter permease PstA [Silanimonas sp.]|uniref:phosphate ABC transporter permease PstA n=1 Tax=Silanimonas sp. TaxID=1929290 RepID=UPI0022CB01A5|nr:phosphate ABC transporter permease PstA [Silanimonas sp.]MCZ8114433.1 phosphate ABC transporter permease PstA [Silanimonas sp.]